jgi:hypothetical protein
MAAKIKDIRMLLWVPLKLTARLDSSFQHRQWVRYEGDIDTSSGNKALQFWMIRSRQSLYSTLGGPRELDTVQGVGEDVAELLHRVFDRAEEDEDIFLLFLYRNGTWVGLG